MEVLENQAHSSFAPGDHFYYASSSSAASNQVHQHQANQYHPQHTNPHLQQVASTGENDNLLNNSLIGDDTYTSTPRLASNLYDIMPGSMQYVLYDFWEMYRNPDLNKYALFNGGPWLVTLFIASYLYFVLRAGPKWMESREAFDLKPLIRVYNFGMVIFNAYLFYHASPFLNFGLYCWGCKQALQPMARDSIPVVWLVLVSRFFDFFDTVFFVLRKKFTHVSFLHVFHHTVVPIGFWIGIKFAFFPVCCFIPYLNLVVHVIMYSYYGLSTFGPKIQKYLWWKKYLTRLQILQFLIALVHSLQPLFQPCTFPVIFVMGQTLGAILFLWLFMSFYFKAYRMQRNAPAQAAGEGEPIANKKSQ